MTKKYKTSVLKKHCLLTALSLGLSGLLVAPSASAADQATELLNTISSGITDLLNATDEPAAKPSANPSKPPIHSAKKPASRPSSGLIKELQMGDVACYVEFKANDGKNYNEMADFEICDLKIVGKQVKFEYQITEVLADSCQGNPDCKKTKKVPLIISATLIKDAAASGTGLEISETGLGGINASTPFNQNVIQKLLPGYTVKIKKEEGEAGIYRVMTISQKNKTVAMINPVEGGTRIFNIRVRSNQITNALGPKIGADFKSIFGSKVGNACTPGEEEFSGMVLCPAPQSSHLSYLFSGKYDGPDGELPPMPQLKSFTVAEIIWRP